MVGQLASVVAGPIDESGFSTAHELTPHKIHAGRTNDPSVMPDHAFAVENRDFEPRVVGPVARSPNDRFDLTDNEIQAADGKTLIILFSLGQVNSCGRSGISKSLLAPPTVVNAAPAGHDLRRFALPLQPALHA
jgi:hypothetical protein